MTLSTTKRIGLAATAIAIGVAVWWWQRPAEGFLRGMVPIDGDRTIFTMRHNPNNGPARAWVGLLDSSGEVAWSHELPGLTYSTYARHGITVSDDLSPSIEFADKEAPSMMPAVSGERPTTDGKQLIHGDADGERSLLVARNAADGTRSWEHEVASGMRELLFSADAVAYRADKAWTFLSRSSGEVARQLDADAAGCGDVERPRDVGRRPTHHGRLERPRQP